MASGHVNRTKRPNTWAHRPMLHAGKKLLPTRSRPHMGDQRTWVRRSPRSVDDPKADLATPSCRAPQILEYLFGAGVGVA